MIDQSETASVGCAQCEWIPGCRNRMRSSRRRDADRHGPRRFPGGREHLRLFAVLPAAAHARKRRIAAGPEGGLCFSRSRRLQPTWKSRLLLPGRDTNPMGDASHRRVHYRSSSTIDRNLFVERCCAFCGSFMSMTSISFTAPNGAHVCPATTVAGTIPIYDSSTYIPPNGHYYGQRNQPELARIECSPPLLSKGNQRLRGN